MLPALDAPLLATLDAAGSEADRLAEAGVDGLFTYEGRSDPFLPLAAIDRRHTQFRYTNIAVALPRSPMHLAMAAWDLAQLTDGRFALGIGTQIKAHIERRYGATWDRPLAQIRETMAALRAIFDTWQNGTPLAFEGEWTTHNLMPPTLTPAPLQSGPPPIWLAALGPKMTALAGAEADGLLVHPFTSERHIREQTLANLETGLDAAGRTRADVTVVIGAIVGLHRPGEDPAGARLGVTALLGFYGSTPAYRPVLDIHGWGDLQPTLRTMTRQGEWGALGDQFSEEQINTLSLVGTPQEVAQRLHERFGDSADRIALSLPGLSDTSLLEELVAEYRSISD